MLPAGKPLDFSARIQNKRITKLRYGQRKALSFSRVKLASSTYFFFLGGIFPRKRQVFGEKPAENWKHPSVTSTLRPVVNSNRTSAQSPNN